MSGNMNMMYERTICINYQVCDGYYHTIIHENLYIGPIYIYIYIYIYIGLCEH